MVEQCVAGRLGDEVLDRDQHPAGEVAVAGVLDLPADGQHRHVVGFGVEVSCDHDGGLGIGGEDLVDQPPYLQGLAHALHRGDEVTLGPAVGAGPGVGVKHLARDLGGIFDLRCTFMTCNWPPPAG
jgi:hypothetical protein